MALYRTSIACEGLSGRALRKLPFLAHASFVQTTCSLEKFIEALNLALEREYRDRSKLIEATI